MIYIDNGITGANVTKVTKEGGPAQDFEYVVNYKPKIYPIEWKNKTETLSGSPISKAKLKGQYFLPGTMKEENGKIIRNNNNLIDKSLIVIDIDDTNLSYNDLIYFAVERLGDYNFYIYPTASHTDKETRTRLIIEPEKAMNETEYKAVVNEISTLLNIKVDNASKTWSQHMGLPIGFKGLESDFKTYHNEGKPYPINTIDDSFADEKNVDRLPFKIDNEIPKGERNSTLFRLAASLQTKGLDKASITAALLAENEAKCNPPLEIKEVESIIKSATTRYIKGDNDYSINYNSENDNIKDNENEDKKFFLIPKNVLRPEKGLRVNVSLLAIYMKKKYEIKIYKQQFRVKNNNYYAHIENMKGLIGQEIPPAYRLPGNIKDCEELLLIDRDLELRDEELADQRYISFMNGVLNVENMEFRLHSDESTQTLLFINQVGCNWNPDIKEDSITDLFFNSATNGNKEDIKYLYQILGVLISGYRSFKNIFFFMGEKDTGKSRYLSLAELLLTNPDGTKDYSNIGLRVLTDETSKEFSRIIGKRGNIAAETPNMHITNDTLLKQLSGGDSISANVKFKDSINFKNKAMLIFAGNTIPKFFSSDKSAIGERLLIYRFKNRIPKKSQIKNIEKKMNLEYVAARAIKELREFIKNNQEFSIPNEIEAHREEMLQDSDTIYKFYKTCVLVTDNEKDRVSNNDLYGEYILFLVNEGHLRLNQWDHKPDLSKLKVTQYVFVSEIKKYHGEDRFKRRITYKSSKADCFVGLIINRGSAGTGEFEEEFSSTNETENKVIQGAFGNSPF